MKYQNVYQISVVILAIAVVGAFGVFFYRELFPEYKVYQYTYRELEKFRSSYTHEPPAPFATGVKQIVISNPQNGPEMIDRCTSCHVALDLPHFAQTRIARDVNDNVIYDEKGKPLLEENPDYIWKKLDDKIQQLQRPDILAVLEERGQKKEASARAKEANALRALKVKTIDGKPIDMTKALNAHPLIGQETRPFEYHPLDDLACASCHGGNGRALVADRAHGPVYDGAYEKAHHGPKPVFTESDSENDPKFASMYNSKPAHELTFQTTPLMAGPLIQAKCMQCHQSATSQFLSAVNKFSRFAEQKKKEIQSIQNGVENDEKALVTLLSLHSLIQEDGIEGTMAHLNEKLGNFHLSSDELDNAAAQFAYLKENEEAETSILRDLIRLTGSEEVSKKLLRDSVKRDDIPLFVNTYVERKKLASIETRKELVQKNEKVLKRFERAADPLINLSKNKALIKAACGGVDELVESYARGKELFVSQGCFACHRIAGFSRASVGPELTKEGLAYPWFVKESIVWPQADTPASTMPNYRLDHDEVADLMTFLMAQTGNTKAISEVDYQISVKEWEAGKKLPWEKSIAPSEIQDVQQGMFVFATEGCAACHRLQGFRSNCGFALETKEGISAKDILEEREWFRDLIPEDALGSYIAEVATKHGNEIDKRLVHNVRSGGVLEEIEEKFPGLIVGFYTNFKFAERAKNTVYKDQPELLEAYKKRIHLLLMAYIQEYGLGRQVAPRLNWSGIYRDDAWLLGHFHNPQSFTARSLMPVMPFDDTKFYQLSHMLHVLGKENRDRLKEVWHIQGFSPPLAYETLCSQCHGEMRQGNGPVAEWIYPIPKNLKNPVFMKHLTKERLIDSIAHGVHGTPMPPWGETVAKAGQPVLSSFEILELANWLYQGIPESSRIEEKSPTEKWRYTILDVVKEMKEEKRYLLPISKEEERDIEACCASYFEERFNPSGSLDSTQYYIREKYYTQENLGEGQRFFEVNCAICHGTEGAGTGLRAGAMVEAKPRMLTNVPWIRKQDDLKLLRSIKYGVSGTAMVPWGDQTNSAQRMQLAMFIRSLSLQQVIRDSLEEILYEGFDYANEVVEKARAQEALTLKKEQNRLMEIEEKLVELTAEQENSFDQAAELFLEKIQRQREVANGEKRDDLYKELQSLIEQERRTYKSVGEQFISPEISSTYANYFLEIARNKPLSYSESGTLSLLFSNEKKERSKAFLLLLENALQGKIEGYQSLIEKEKQKAFDEEKKQLIQKALDSQRTYVNLKTKLFIQMSEAEALRNKQTKVYEKLYGSSQTR